LTGKVGDYHSEKDAETKSAEDQVAFSRQTKYATGQRAQDAKGQAEEGEVAGTPAETFITSASPRFFLRERIIPRILPLIMFIPGYAFTPRGFARSAKSLARPPP
jgi:hypothetical protein